MSLERFSNLDSISNNTGLQRGIVWSNDILPSLMLDTRVITLTDNVNVEVFVYLNNNTFIAGGSISDFIVNTNKIYIDYAKVLNGLQIPRGHFRVVTNIQSNLIGNVQKRVLQVKEISPDRRELLIELVPLNETEFAEYNGCFDRYFQEYDSAFVGDIALNFGDNELYKVINQKPWQYPNSIVVRLYSPLAQTINVNDTLWMVEELATPYIDNINLHSTAPETTFNALRGPNFEIDSEYNTITETEFKSWNDLLGSNLTTSQQVINSYFSGSDIPINIDYTAFDNFVFYGSATERLSNFKYKLELLEYYDSQLNVLNNAVGSTTAFANNIDLYNNRKQELLGTFDNFEKWLYYEPTASLTTHGTSGSYIGSDGYALTPWPKYLSASAYYAHHTTSSIALSWYNGFLATASLYDDNNDNSLAKTIPQHIRDDENNSEYELFVDMIGQHFDILYTYINALSTLYKPEEQPKLGIDKTTLNEIASSMGWKLANGRQASSLWQYKLGVDGNGQYMSTGSLFSKSDEDLTTEIWRRIVNNLPYLLKTKGTARSIKALMNVYGIPQTLLSIREYGGPHPDADTPALIEDRFAYKLYISGSEDTGDVTSVYYTSTPYLVSSGSWNSGITNAVNNVVAPMSRELRFQPLSKRNMSLLSTRSTTNTSVKSIITLEYTGSYSGSSDYGRVWISSYSSSIAGDLESAHTDWLPLYDGDMWNLHWWWTTSGNHYNTGSNTDTTYHIQVQKASDYINGKIVHSASASITPTDPLHFSYWSGQMTGYSPYTSAARRVYIGGSTNPSYYELLPVTNTIYPFNGYVQEYREWIETLNQTAFNIHTLNPASHVSSLSPTSSYDRLVRRYTFGSDVNAIDHSVYTSVTSSHPAYAITDFNGVLSGTSYGIATGSLQVTGLAPDPQRGFYEPFEETYYIDAVSLGGQLPRSEKIRLEDNYLIRRLSPTNTAERSSFDYAPIDSNRLGLFYSQADQVNKDIFDQIGDVALDDYVGSPADEFELQYNNLSSFSNQYWKKYTNRNDINAFIRVFSQFDFTLFNQIKQLLPARVDSVMGLLVEPHALERNKIAITKRIGVENPQYAFTITELQPSASSDVITEYTGSIVSLYSFSGESVYHSGSSNGYSDSENSVANIIVRDHVIPSDYLIEEIPIDQIGNAITPFISRNFYNNNTGLVRETGLTGNPWKLLLPYNASINTTSASVDPGEITDQLVTVYNNNNQFDIVYNTVTVTVNIEDIPNGGNGTVTTKCSLCLVDNNDIITYIKTLSDVVILSSGMATINLLFENIRIPAYTNFGITLDFQTDISSDPLNLCITNLDLSLELESVYTSVIRPEIIDQTLTPSYYRKQYYYSGSINTSDKILKNAYHATSQSLGLYYSSSLQPVNFQYDDILQYNNPRYDGCKMVGPDINVNSTIAAIGNSPVIEVFETNANQLIFTNTPVNRSTGNNREPGNLTIR